MVSRRIRQFAVVSLFAGLFTLRASLSSSPGGIGLSPCPGEQLTAVVWTANLTLNYTGCGVMFTTNISEVFYTMSVCGTVMTLYGFSVLIRYGLP